MAVAGVQRAVGVNLNANYNSLFFLSYQSASFSRGLLRLSEAALVLNRSCRDMRASSVYQLFPFLEASTY